MPSFLAKMNPREQMIIAVALGAGVIAAIVFLLVMPQMRAKSELITKQQAATEEVAKAQSALQEAREIKANVAQTRSRLAKLRLAVPVDSQLPALIVDLPQVVGEAGVALAAFSPGEGSAEGGVTKQPVEFTVKGDFFDILDFLYRLQNFPRYFKVNKVVVASTTAAGGQEADSGSTADAGQLQATVSALTFYTAPPPKIATTEPGK